MQTKEVDDMYILTIHSRGQFEGLFTSPELAMRYVYMMCLYLIMSGDYPIENMLKRINLIREAREKGRSWGLQVFMEHSLLALKWNKIL